MGAVPIGGFTPLVVTPGTNQNMVFSGPNMSGLINSKPTGSLLFCLQNFFYPFHPSKNHN